MSAIGVLLLFESMRYPIAVVTRPSESVYMTSDSPSHGCCVLAKASTTLSRVAMPPVVDPSPGGTMQSIRDPKPGGVTSSHDLTYIAIHSTMSGGTSQPRDW